MKKITLLLVVFTAINLFYAGTAENAFNKQTNA